MIEVIVLVASLMLSYLIGRIHGAKWMWNWMTEQERLARRIEPSRRTAGLPTNLEAPSSDVRKARWRSGAFYNPDSKEW